jgi:hypothetical protein
MQRADAGGVFGVRPYLNFRFMALFAFGGRAQVIVSGSGSRDGIRAEKNRDGCDSSGGKSLKQCGCFHKLSGLM